MRGVRSLGIVHSVIRDSWSTNHVVVALLVRNRDPEGFDSAELFTFSGAEIEFMREFYMSSQNAGLSLGWVLKGHHKETEP